MMSALILFLCPLLSTGVFGDNVLSVMEGESVTLHADAKIKINQIEWRFGQRLIASIYTQTNDTSVDPEGAFGGRLQLDNQTGDLKITNIRISDSGEYKLKINRKEPMTFTVSVVPANPVKTVSVMEADSVTLNTELQRYDVIQWTFGPQHSPIAEINRKTRLFSTSDGPDGRFRDRLKLEYSTGSLTIRNIRTRHSGLYEVDIGTSNHTIHKSFNVTVSGEIKSVLSVMEGESVTLDTGLTEIQTDDSIHWMFGDTDIAEIYKAYNRFSFNDDERFRDRLKLDQKTGSLTITNIRTTDSGDYELKIISSRLTVHKRITVTVTGPGWSSGAVAWIVVGVLMAVVGAGAGAAVVIYYRRRISELERQMPETVGVTEGVSVPLIPKDIKIHKDDDIQLKFRGSLIAERKGENREITVPDDVRDGIFKGRLKLDKDSGSLTITDITSDMSGLYELWIIRRGREPFMKTFYVSVIRRTLAVIEGESVPLIPKDIKIHKDDDIQWRYAGTLIAERKGVNGEITVHDDGIFKDRLKLDKDSGSLTITDIRFPMSGRYDLRIIKRGHETLMTCRVSVFPKTDDVMTVLVKKGDPLTLSSGVTEIQRDDEIQWMFGLENSPIAQIKGGTTETFPSAADGIFRDRLELDQNGSLTIENIRPKDAGLYHLYFTKTGESIKSFRVIVRNPKDIRKTSEEGMPLV